jgi:hypothetical protein
MTNAENLVGMLVIRVVEKISEKIRANFSTPRRRGNYDPQEIQ